jgi:hypothetical protein
MSLLWEVTTVASSFSGKFTHSRKFLFTYPLKDFSSEISSLLRVIDCTLKLESVPTEKKFEEWCLLGCYAVWLL